jgi:hypothetical protein
MLRKAAVLIPCAGQLRREGRGKACERRATQKTAITDHALPDTHLTGRKPEQPTVFRYFSLLLERSLIAFAIALPWAFRCCCLNQSVLASRCSCSRPSLRKLS